MRCQEARKWISPYLDSELDSTKTFEVSQHLEHCDPCRDRFEKEARAEEIIAASLRREVEYVEWAALERQIAAPPRRVMPIKPRWLLAAAACIAFLLISLGEWPGRTIAGDPAQWAIDELHDLSPQCEPFSGGAGCTVGDIATLVATVLDCKLALSMSDGRLGGHAIELAGVRQRACSAGKSRVQIRLNCCGNPALLIIASMEQEGALRAVVEAVRTHKGRFEELRESYDRTFHVGAVQNGGYVVIAVAPHTVGHLLSQVTVASR